MNRFKKQNTKTRKKTSLYICCVVLLAVVFVGVLYMFVSATPRYSVLGQKSFLGYTYKSFIGWSQVDSSSDSLQTVQYLDYIYDVKDRNSAQGTDLYAQYIVSVEQKAVPTSALTAVTKADLKSELSNTNGKLFSSLQQSIAGCSVLQNASSSVSDTDTKNSFLSVNFSFYCIQPDKKAPIRAVGKVIFADDGSAVTAIILAADAVYAKNEAIFKTVLGSVEKQ